MNDGRSHEGSAGNGSALPESPRETWYDRLLQVLGLRSKDNIRTDLEDVLAGAAEDPNFSPYERAMLKNVLGFHRVKVHDVMVPRADIVAVSSDTTLGELLRIFRTAGHSRLPVYGETLDDPKGMVHIRDFLDFLVARAENGTRRRRVKDVTVPSLSNIDLSMTLANAKVLRPVLFAPPSMPAVDLLVRMQATRTHMALVIDEYGGTDGLVSIEDLVETVVGDIEDEHDEAAARMIVREGDGFVADARIGLDEASEAIGVALALTDLSEEVETLGGLVATLAGRVPTRGELIAGPNDLEFEVLDADPRRLKRVRISHQRAPAPDPAPRVRPAPPAPDGASPPQPAPLPPPEASRPSA